MTNTLYRFYDDRNRLLYVGITVNVPARVRKHAASKDWWGEVATIKLENFDSRTALVHAEQCAIELEGPRHNIVRNRLLALGLSLNNFRVPCYTCQADVRARHYPEHQDHRSPLQLPESYFITDDSRFFQGRYRCCLHAEHKWTWTFEL